MDAGKDNDSLKTEFQKNWLAIIITAIVVVSGLVFYFYNFGFSSLTSPLAEEKQEKKHAAGVVAKIGDSSFDVYSVDDEGEKKESTFKVSAETQFFRIDFLKGEPQPVNVPFHFLAQDQNVTVEYYRKGFNDIASRVDIINLAPPTGAASKAPAEAPPGAF